MEKKNCFREKREWIYWIAALIPFVISFLYYPRMPQQVPTQWSWDGQIRGYSSPLMACFGIPAFMVIMEIVVALAFQLDPKKKSIDRSGALAWIVRWLMVVLGIIVEAVIVASGLGYF